MRLFAVPCLENPHARLSRRLVRDSARAAQGLKRCEWAGATRGRENSFAQYRIRLLRNKAATEMSACMPFRRLPGMSPSRQS
jgi:hypothetical protein